MRPRVASFRHGREEAGNTAGRTRGAELPGGARIAMRGLALAGNGLRRLTVAYGLSWPIAAAVGFGFHEVAFAPLLTALALERLQKGRLKTALVMLAGLVLIKEDMGLYVAGLLLAIFVFIPAMGGGSSYYWGYRELGPNGPAAVKHILEHPLSSMSYLFKPAVELHTMLELFAPFLFLCFLSPYVLAVIPLLLERMLGVRYPAWWSNLYQHNAYLVVPIALGAVDGALRLERRGRRQRRRVLRRARHRGAMGQRQPRVPRLGGGIRIRARVRVPQSGRPGAAGGYARAWRLTDNGRSTRA
jgi:hypothetical protein